MNYTKEQAQYMVNVYSKNPSRETVEKLAEEMGKSIKSIIGKLSREGVYRREVYRTKLGETPIRKIDIVNEIAEQLNVDSEDLKGLEKTPKHVLKLLERCLKSE